MNRLLALLLSAVIALPGCAIAPVARRTLMRPPQPGSAQPPVITREYARQLAVGSKVKVALRTGDRFSATYMGVEGDSVRVQKRTRVPEPPLVLPLTSLSALELDTGGIGLGKAIAIGAGVGAGAIVATLLILAAAWD